MSAPRLWNIFRRESLKTIINLHLWQLLGGGGGGVRSNIFISTYDQMPPLTEMEITKSWLKKLVIESFWKVGSKAIGFNLDYTPEV